MDNLDKTLLELKDTQDYIQGRLVDKVAFTKFVQSLVTVWHKLRTTFEQKLQEASSKVDQELAQNKDILVKGLSALRSEIGTLRSDVAVSHKELRNSINKELRQLRNDIDDVEASIPDEFNPTKLQLQLESVKKSIAQITTQQEVWDRFAKLEKKVRAIEDTKPSVIRQVFGGGRPVHVPMVDDFSTLTDGSNKQFYLSKQPRSLNTIKIWGSDFPYILRANVDFTVVGKLVTLTSEVDAPSSGSNLIAEYYI